MVDSTAEDWAILSKHSKQVGRGLVDRVLEHLKALADEPVAFPVDRFEHSLQSASMAFRDGMDDEYIVCALLHDIGDNLGTFNHADLAAAILKPFISPENLWMVERHDMFQGYYFFHHVGFDRNVREQFRGHPCFERTLIFSTRYDQAAFDRNYDTMPLEAFEPIVRRVMMRPKAPVYMRPYRQAPSKPKGNVPPRLRGA
jgi:predicted HD phosphohydrolase